MPRVDDHLGKKINKVNAKNTCFSSTKVSAITDCQSEFCSGLMVKRQFSIMILSGNLVISCL